MERRVREELGRAAQRGRDRVAAAARRRRRPSTPNAAHTDVDDRVASSSRRARSPIVSASTTRRLIARDRGRGERPRRRGPGTRTVIVSKNASCTTSTPPVAQARGEPHRVAGARARRSRAALGPVVRGVQAGDHREQHLRGADVARRLLAPDVLLARLQREPERGAALRVDRHADEPTRQRALVLVARREDTRRAVRRSRAARRSAATCRRRRRRRSRRAGRRA